MTYAFGVKAALPHTNRTRAARIWLAGAVSFQSSRLGTSCCTGKPEHAWTLRNPWCGADHSRHCRFAPGRLRRAFERVCAHETAHAAIRCVRSASRSRWAS